MEYKALVKPPPQPNAQRYAAERCVGPLRRAREVGATAPGKWWREPATLTLLAKQLHDATWLLVEDFLTPEVAATLEASVASRPEGVPPTDGNIDGWIKGGTASSHGWREHRRGDIDRFSASDEQMPGTSAFFEAGGALLLGLRQNGNPEVEEWLRHVDFHNDAMFAVYPGGASRYVKHIDNAQWPTDGRRVTMILYLNREWEPAHGGCLRLYEPGIANMQTKADIEPLHNRLVVFWSEEMPHEVLPCHAARAAVSMWFIDTKESLKTYDGFKRVALRHVVGPQDRGERLIAAAEDDKQLRLLRVLGLDATRMTLDDQISNKQDLADKEAILAGFETDFWASPEEERLWERLARTFKWNMHARYAADDLARWRASNPDMFALLGVDVPPGTLSSSASPLAGTSGAAPPSPAYSHGAHASAAAGSVRWEAAD
eukprot:NODE_9536_length_1417_cov_3.268992.p1 GENE.NODE_9536_length_1417_cov_3.268992~~NODE_9536_length_1417_cov_3.268992.p1  ORF type:complete len:431 (+),score=121.58 NODE_9536_length_1417_cov_3.268992:49-1341(+)